MLVSRHMLSTYPPFWLSTILLFQPYQWVCIPFPYPMATLLFMVLLAIFILLLFFHYLQKLSRPSPFRQISPLFDRSPSFNRRSPSWPFHLQQWDQLFPLACLRYHRCHLLVIGRLSCQQYLLYCSIPYLIIIKNLVNYKQ